MVLTIAELPHQQWVEFAEAEKALLDACEVAGFAAVKKRTENPCTKLGFHKRHSYECWQAAPRPQSANKAAQAQLAEAPSKKRRNRVSKKGTCPWAAVLSYYTDKQAWVFLYKSPEHIEHNHEMSDEPEKIRANWRRAAREGREPGTKLVPDPITKPAAAVEDEIEISLSFSIAGVAYRGSGRVKVSQVDPGLGTISRLFNRDANGVISEDRDAPFDSPPSQGDVATHQSPRAGPSNDGLSFHLGPLG